jgi:spore germination cell wall hydrolase CwlJ-like protein
MKIKKTIIDAIKLYFEPITHWSANKQFRWTIVAIVILAVILAFSSKAEAAHKAAAEQPPVLETVPKKSNELYSRDTHPIEYCIALNIYYESRADNISGKYAVADVVLNRVNDPRFPNTVCEVVEQAVMYESWKTAQHEDIPHEERIFYPKRNKCQFSWFCDGKPDEPQHQDAWRESQIISWNIVQFQRFRGITDGATHYHATYVDPYWTSSFDSKGQIGSHIFYRWAMSKDKKVSPADIGTDGYEYSVPFESRIPAE